MRIRTGFVSNSSSTSFLIITHDELEEEAFMEMMGIGPASQIQDRFKGPFSLVIY